jgi:hypothetical protein
MGIFKRAAEEENYILATSNGIHDSIKVSRNVLVAGRMIAKVSSLFPLDSSRLYTAGYSNGGRLASLIPIFFKDIAGVVSVSSSLANPDLITTRNPFHFIGIVGKEDYVYRALLRDEKLLNKNKFKNNFIISAGGKEWPDHADLQKALRLFTLSAMAKGEIAKDSLYLSKSYKTDLKQIKNLKNNKRMLLAEKALAEMVKVYRIHMNIDSLKTAKRNLQKDKLYRTQKKSEKAAFFKEDLLKEDYIYYLEEDLITYNYNNLGWWNYQTDELNKFLKSESISERQMGKRLYGYLNVLIEDYFVTLKAGDVTDDEALILLSMLKTITEPKNYEYYLNVISLSSKYEDYGTARFYLEEAFKKGFKDKEKLDNLEHTALLRITPEYNKLMDKYLDEARYHITDE